MEIIIKLLRARPLSCWRRRLQRQQRLSRQVVCLSVNCNRKICDKTATTDYRDSRKI